MKYFASRIAQRVLTSLILAAIFGVVAHCAKGASVSVSSSSSYGGAVATATATWNTTGSPGNGVLSTVHTVTRVTPSGHDHIGEVHAYFVPSSQGANTPKAAGKGEIYTNGYASPGSGSASIYSNIADPGTGFDLVLVTRIGGSAQYDVKTERIPLNGAPTAKKITLTYTNPKLSSDPMGGYMWAGWRKTGSTWVQGLDWVGPAETKTWNVYSEPGDTATYETVAIDPADWNGTVPTNGKAANDPQKAWDFAGVPTTAGTPKGYADGTAITGNESPVEPPPSTTPPTTATPQAPGTAPGSGSTTPTPQLPKVVPAAPTAAPTQGTQADNTNAILQGLQGVAGQVANLKTAAGGGAIGGGGTDMSGVESRLDELKTKWDTKVTKDADDKTDAETAATDAKNSAAAEGATAGTGLKAIIGTAPTDPPALSVGGDYASLLTVTMPASMGGRTLNVNPFANATIKAMANGLRTALQWLALIMLGSWIWQQMSEWIRGVAAAQQAKGNPVFAGTGAQATALLMATAITAAVVVAITALMAFTFGEISMGFLKSNAAINPLAGFSAATLGFLGEIFPIVTMISCLICRMTFNMYAAGIYAVVMSVIRFAVA